MADTYNARSFSDVPVREHNRVIERVYEDISRTLDLADDTIKFFQLPEGGVKLLGGVIESEDLDAGTAVTLDLIVTDGTTTHILIADTTVAQAGGVISTMDSQTGSNQTGWYGKVLTGSDWYVAVRVGTAPTTPAAGKVKAGIRYSCDVEAGELG